MHIYIYMYMFMASMLMLCTVSIRDIFYMNIRTIVRYSTICLWVIYWETMLLFEELLQDPMSHMRKGLALPLGMGLLGRSVRSIWICMVCPSSWKYQTS